MRTFGGSCTRWADPHASLSAVSLSDAAARIVSERSSSRSMHERSSWGPGAAWVQRVATAVMCLRCEGNDEKTQGKRGLLRVRERRKAHHARKGRIVLAHNPPVVVLDDLDAPPLRHVARPPPLRVLRPRAAAAAGLGAPRGGARLPGRYVRRPRRPRRPRPVMQHLRTYTALKSFPTLH